MHLCCRFTAYEGPHIPHAPRTLRIAWWMQGIVGMSLFFLSRHGPKGGMPIHYWNTKNKTFCEPDIDTLGIVSIQAIPSIKMASRKNTSHFTLQSISVFHLQAFLQVTRRQKGEGIGEPFYASFFILFCWHKNEPLCSKPVALGQELKEAVISSAVG